MTENEISYIIRGCIFKVYNELGPGLFESVYKAALSFEIIAAGLTCELEVAVPVLYKGVNLDVGFRMDLLVGGKVAIEIKSIEAIANVHHKQILTYLKITRLKLGILVNFNTDEIDSQIIRKVNGL